MNTSVGPTGQETLVGAVRRLEQLILSHCGEDAFEETLKLLLAKLHDEQQSEEVGFRSHGSAERTGAKIRRLFKESIARWPSLYPSGESVRLPDHVLEGAARLLESQRLIGTALGVLDATLEHLLSRTAKGSMGQYFTPRNVVSLCVDVLKPQPNEVVLDPACGSGGFLVTALQMANQGGRGALRAVGFDLDVRAFRVARIMAAVAGNGNMTLSRRNTLDAGGTDLDDDRRFANRFGVISKFCADVILTNPPFGGDVTDLEVLSRYESPDRKHRRKMPRELLFIERCVQLLKPGGRAAIVAPQGVLANPSLAFFRDWLHGVCKLLGVVSLHPYAFLPHTGVKTSVLFLQRVAKAKSTSGPVFFASSLRPGKDSSGEFLASDGAASYGVTDDLRAIAESFQRFLGQQGHDWAKRLPASNVALPTGVPQHVVRQSGRMDAEFFDPTLLHAVHALSSRNAKPIRSLVSENVRPWRRNGFAINYIDISCVDNRTGQVLPNVTATDEAPSRASYLVKPGDVLVSTVRPERNTIGLVTDASEHELVATNGFCVLRPQGISSELLFAYCKTPLFRRLLSRSATATMYPAVSERDVLDVPLPPIPSEVSKAVESAVHDAHQHFHRGQKLLAQAISLLDAHLAEHVDASPADEQRDGSQPRPSSKIARGFASRRQVKVAQPELYGDGE